MTAVCRHTVDRTFAAMGTTCRILVDGPDPAVVELAAGEAESLVHALEGRWSRFVTTSEICWLNERSGLPAIVSADTLDLVTRARIAHEATDGRFDALLLRDLVALGYDRSHELLGDGGPVGHDTPGFLRPTTADIDVDPWLSTITLPPGASFDPGGIGKGAAADAAADALAQHDLYLWLVSLGGDLRLDGPSVALHGWQLTLEHPFERGVQIARLSVGPTAAATSSVAQRRWRRGDLELHHLLDPRTGRPADTDLVAVTVLAGEAWWAEVLAKAAVIAGRTAAHELLDRHGVRAVLFAEDGSCDVVGMPVDDIDWLTDPKEVNRWN